MSTLLIPHWRIRYNYDKGDTVLFPKNTIYICKKPHESNSVTAPNPECKYWIQLKQKYVSHQSLSDPETQPPSTPIKKTLKRKRTSEVELENYLNKKRHNSGLKERILQLNVPIDIKSILFEKFNYMKNTQSSAEKQKTIQWLNTVCDLPFNIKKSMNISKSSSLQRKQEFFKNIKQTLDTHIYGLEQPKNILIEHIGKMLTSKTKGNVIALSGIAGTGKTCLLRHGLANALNVPFFQINCGGLSDGSFLTGHSDTYVSSRPGKIVEILTKAQCNNPIIYLDEIDKISKSKWREIYGILTHILDPEQNTHFIDNYIPEINIDLSNVTFVLSFNNAQDIDPIVLDRLKIIPIPNPSQQTKLEITQHVLLPKLCKEINIQYANPPPTKKHKGFTMSITQELLEFLISKVSPPNTGVRNIKQALENLLNKINLDLLLSQSTNIHTEITKTHILAILTQDQQEATLEHIRMMYI